ncbi:MAG: hypothetical protein EPO23_07240 [Xanthobacteraceae bacterium]|nr:MAG: hypothetical protein EPO23_07240 [Xanthobacteraceae bacterium]
MQILTILNDPPYGTERVYNGLRLTAALQKASADAIPTVFLMADAVTAAKRGQKTPDGFYNVERMIRHILSASGHVLLCGSCLDARGLVMGDLIDGVRRSTMDELATLAIQAEKVLVF